MFYVYLIKSISHPEQKYIDQTDDLKKRLKQHNAGYSTHTAKYRPWILVNYFAFTSGTPTTDVRIDVTPARAAVPSTTFQFTSVIIAAAGNNESIDCAIVFTALFPAAFTHATVSTFGLNTQFLNIIIPPFYVAALLAEPLTLDTYWSLRRFL
mgnify:CR=1 FL=1